jgi:hypothetical protein
MVFVIASVSSKNSLALATPRNITQMGDDAPYVANRETDLLIQSGTHVPIAHFS